MLFRTLLITGLSFACALVSAAQELPDAMAIMKKVAANTASATEARRQYIYHQRVRASLLQGNGQIVCRESRDYTVIPQEATTEKQLTAFSGECREGRKMVPYARVNADDDRKAHGADGGRAEMSGVIDELADDRKSRDGIPRQLFPLGPGEVEHYRFSLKGQTTVKGRRAYDLTFEPAARRGVCIDAGDEKSGTAVHVDLHGESDDAKTAECRPWKGEVWIDAEDYQPIRIDTQLYKGVPWGVRVFMGINIRNLGFSLTYDRVAPGVWFPATYGTEFRIVVFWGYKRTITLSMENTGFQKTDAQSTIRFEPLEK